MVILFYFIFLFGNWVDRAGGYWKTVFLSQKVSIEQEYWKMWTIVYKTNSLIILHIISSNSRGGIVQFSLLKKMNGTIVKQNQMCYRWCCRAVDIDNWKLCVCMCGCVCFLFHFRFEYNEQWFRHIYFPLFFTWCSYSILWKMVKVVYWFYFAVKSTKFLKVSKGK